MTPYIVQQGDYLAKLAFVHGFEPDEVWNDPKNADLKKLRPDPNVLAPGDVRVGDMDPDTEISGLRKRLENLGLYPRNMPESADREELLHLALIGFQQKMGLDLTGEIDEATRDALKREHLI